MSEKLAAAVAAEIRRRCEALDWSGRELARRTGISRAVVTYKLAGERAWDLDDLEVIAAVFEVQVSELITEAER